jgi:AraC family transcriptional regulator
MTRIKKSKELLLSASLPHARIALDTGFADQSHFCRVFRRIAGTTPTAWQREHGGRSATSA